MTNRIEGKRFNKLVYVGKTDKRDSSKNILCEFKCDCGNTAFIRFYSVFSGKTRSCGCIHKKMYIGNQKVMLV